MRFGEYIKKLRMAKGLTLAKAARELGMTPQRLCDVENGRKNFTRAPPVKTLRLIASVYDHPYANLVTNTEFFQYEKSIITDLLADLEPACFKLENKVLEMVTEARQYTPEMELLTVESLTLVQELKTAVMLAKTRYSRAPRKGTALKPGSPREE